MRRWTSRGGVRYTCLIAVVTMLSGCGDTPAEAGDPGVGKLNPLGPPPPSLNYEAVASAAIGGVSASGSSSEHSTPISPLPNKAYLYRVTASGNVTVTRTPHWHNGPTSPAEGSMGPSGYEGTGPTGATCYANVYVGSSSYYGGETWYAPSCMGAPTSGHVYLAGATTINRASSPFGGQWDCSAPGIGYGPCFQWEDNGQSVTIERVIGDLSVSASATTVNYGDNVTITASVSPDSVEGRALKWTVDSTKWIKAGDSVYSTSPCGGFAPLTGPSRSCTGQFKKSGSLTVFVDVNGESQSETVAIEVLPPKLKVTAGPPDIVIAGTLVTFKATLTPSASYFPLTWSYHPASGASGGSCSWQPLCSRVITESGYMVATTTFDGYVVSDSAEVTVTPCVTGDSILDNEGIRAALLDELTLSNVDSAPNLRAERRGYIYKLPDGSYKLFPATALGTQCQAFLKSPSTLGLPPGSQLVGTYHTHPLVEGDPYSCMFDEGNGPFIRSGILGPEQFGHPSDYNLSWPEWVITKDGWVYRLDPPAPTTYSGGTPHKWRWDQGPGNACTWTY